MKLKQYSITKLIVLAVVLLGVSGSSTLVYNPAPASAASLSDQARCSGGANSCVCSPSNPNPKICGDPAATGDPIIDCNNDGTTDKGCTLFTKYINPLIRLLAGVAGIAVVIGIIYGGIEYSASAGDPQKAAKAKTHIRNSIVAFIFFLFLYTILKFLIPGGNLVTG